jgi:hypothetical protein
LDAIRDCRAFGVITDSYYSSATNLWDYSGDALRR